MSRLPGMPGPTAQAIERQEHIAAAFVQMHQAICPALELLGRGSITLTRNVCGDRLTVTLKPGAEQ